MASTVILSDNGASSGSAGLKQTAGNDGVLILQTTTSGGTATNAIYVDTSQNVGLGVTPSAWGTGYKALDIGLGGSVFADTAYATVILSANTYTNGTNYIYKRSSVGATRYTQFDGAHTWYNAGSGTAGNAITFTQAMTLDASGNLLVGTTSQLSPGGVPGVTSLLNPANNGSWALALQNNATSATQGRGLGIRFATDYNNNANEVIYFAGNATARFVVTSNGNVTNTNNSYGAISDVKLKENITDATPKLAGLMQVRIVNYNLKTDPEHKQIGVVAQELEQVFPSMISESPDYEEITTTDENGNEKTERVATGTTTKSVKYSVFVPMLIKAIQELKAELDTAKEQIAILQGAQQ